MGIPSYFAHIVREHRTIIKKINNLKINNLYLDCNSFIYEAQFSGLKYDVNDIKGYEKEIIKYVCKTLSKYIEQLKPDQRIFIAFDGVAPLAKLNQQRNRRYMTAFQSSLDVSNNKSSNPKWNTSSITPGTEFMNELGLAVKSFFLVPQNFGVQEIIVSNPCDAGEGEHKIYEYIRNDPLYHKDTCTVIYGLDADLIMLTLNHLHISENMYLFRETPEFIKSIDKTLNPNETYLLDIPLFARKIISEMSVNENENENENEIKASVNNNILFDYIFMCFFLGNDFLPHFPSLNIRTNGINRLIDAYKCVFAKSGATFTVDRKIKWKNVRTFIEYLSVNEHTYITEEYIQRDKLSKRAMYDNQEDENLMLPLKERSAELYINPNEAGWETRYYKVLFDIQINDDRRKEICINYLEGLEWTMNYYSIGCSNWRWMYNYYYPPLLVDLLKYIPISDTIFVPVQVKNPVSSLVQLSYVLPPVSMSLLPNQLREKLLKEQPQWYVGNYVFLWSFCKFFWEAHVHLPKIDINVLDKIVNS